MSKRESNMRLETIDHKPMTVLLKSALTASAPKPRFHSLSHALRAFRIQSLLVFPATSASVLQVRGKHNPQKPSCRSIILDLGNEEYATKL